MAAAAMTAFASAGPDMTLSFVPTVARGGRLPGRNGPRADAPALGAPLPSAGEAAPGTLACLAATALAIGAARYCRKMTRNRRAARAAQADDAPVALGRAQVLRGLGGVGFSSMSLLLSPSPALALSRDDAKKALTNYGCADLMPSDVPSNWEVAVEPIGYLNDAEDGRNKLGGLPQVVTFAYPSNWTLQRPNYDFNGSAGTVAVNDYGKGDSVTFWADTDYTGPDLEAMKKGDFYKEIRRAITQRGSSFVDEFKVRKVMDGAPGYKIVEYNYDLNSPAGFTIARAGMAAVTLQGTKDGKRFLQVLWGGILQPRWNKDTQETLDRITRSFRVGELPKEDAERLRGKSGKVGEEDED